MADRLPPPNSPFILSPIPEFITPVRYWGDRSLPAEIDPAETLAKQILSDPGYDPSQPAAILSISGGGANGAFSAGLINGWSQSETKRPQFRLVTGVSTGSLIAPFAFLGEAGDAAIKTLFTQNSTTNILNPAKPLDNARLRKVYTEQFTPRHMEQIATLHLKGRRLLIATTYLDVLRPVVWDLGAIANSGSPDAYDTIINCILASVAVPGLYTHILFDVGTPANSYNELHVDGGVSKIEFLNPTVQRMMTALKIAKHKGSTNIYILHNTGVVPKVRPIQTDVSSVINGAQSSMFRNIGLNDISLAYVYTKKVNASYNLATIPRSFQLNPKEIFDKAYMNALFNLAYTQAIQPSGYPWQNQPPQTDPK
jgi:hypothetical protein